MESNLDPFPGLAFCHYGLILADPPWHFRAWKEVEGAPTKSPSRHYGLMSLQEIERLPVRDLAASDSVLVLWLTQAMVPQGLRVMEAWGFTYKTMGAWAKQSRTGRSWAFGTGYLLRSAAEFFAVGTRGSLPSRARDVRNLIVAPVAEHSRKPDALHIALERMYPGVPKLELFARRRRCGWDSWGDV